MNRSLLRRAANGLYVFYRDGADIALYTGLFWTAIMLIVGAVWGELPAALHSTTILVSTTMAVQICSVIIVMYVQTLWRRR